MTSALALMRKLPETLRGTMMKKIGQAVFGIALTITLSACMTPYQERGATGGYTDKQIADNVYYVTFSGNGNTPRDRVFRFWLYRCAELTKSKGYDYFVIASTPVRGSSDAARAAVAYAGEYNEIEPTAAGAPTFVYIPGGTIRTYSANGYIELYRGKPDSDNPRAFRAADVIRDLGPEVLEKTSTTEAPSNRYDPDVVLSPARGIAQSAPSKQLRMEDLEGLLPAAR